MKKHSQLVMILSALLCLAMLFASCTPAPDEDETVGETGTETETVIDTEPETEEEVTMEPEPTPDNQMQGPDRKDRSLHRENE